MYWNLQYISFHWFLILTNLPSNVLLMRSLNLSLLSEVIEDGVCISTCCFSSIRQSSQIRGLSKFLADPSSSPLISRSCSRVSTDFWNTGGNMKFIQSNTTIFRLLTVHCIVFSVYLIRCDFKCFVFQIALTWHHEIIFNKLYSTISMPVVLL